MFPCTQLEGVDTGDFHGTSAAVFLLSTETSKTIFLTVKDDDLPEADETFTFNLTIQVMAHFISISLCCFYFVLFFAFFSYFIWNVCFFIACFPT